MITSDTNVTKNLIKSQVVLSNTYVDFGSRINTKGIDNIALWLKGVLNDSDLVRMRVKCYKSHNGIDPYYTQVQMIGQDTVGLSEESYEISSANINLVLPLGISTLAPYIQIEAKVDTAGATAAQIDEAFVSFDRR